MSDQSSATPSREYVAQALKVVQQWLTECDNRDNLPPNTMIAVLAAFADTSLRSETVPSMEIVQLLRDIQRNANIGAPHWSGIDQRINDVLRNAARRPESSEVAVAEPAQDVARPAAASALRTERGAMSEEDRIAGRHAYPGDD